MITTNVPILKIHKLAQAQYDRELANGNIDENALYLTPEDNTASGGGTYIIPIDFDYNIDSSFSFSWDELLAAIDNNYYVAIRIEDSEGYYRDYIFNRDMRSDNEIIFVHIDQQGIYQLSIYNDATVNGGSRTLKTDTTLSLIQHPADAKAVGDALATKAPVYTYGTEDLVAGESELAAGTLYFVYEEEE